MGLIATRLADFSETRFDRAAWLNGEDDEGAPTSAGVSVSLSSALTIPAVLRCVDILASSVAGSPRDVVIKVGGRTFPEYSNVPRWVDEPNPADPTLTGDDYIYSLVSSLVVEGNYFVHAYPNVLAPEALTVLAPERVTMPNDSSEFEILDDKGKVIAVLGPSEMLHRRMFTWPGQRRGISILEKMRRTLGSSIAADDFAARFFGQGAALSFGVEVPNQLTEDQKKDLRANLKARYQGNRNSHAIGVLTAGAKFVGGLAPTPEQAQMLETRKFSVEEIARVFGVPPYMLGSQEPGASSYASTETAQKTFAERTVLPLVLRIEAQHNRLLAEFSPVVGGKAQFKLNMDHLLRADLLARFQAYEIGTRAGVLKPDEAREKENLGPVPGGDRVYMQSQMTPIAQLGTVAAAPVPAAPVRSEQLEVVRASEPSVSIVMTQPEEMARAVMEASAEEAGQMMEAMDRLAEAVLGQTAPVVNVTVEPTPVEINVSPTPVEINVPQQPPAMVNVSTPDEIAITRMPARLTTRTVTKRTREGIVETQDIEADL